MGQLPPSPYGCPMNDDRDLWTQLLSIFGIF